MNRSHRFLLPMLAPHPLILVFFLLILFLCPASSQTVSFDPAPQEIIGHNGKQPGDPTKAAQAIVGPTQGAETSVATTARQRCV